MEVESPQELHGLESSAPSERAKSAGWLVQHPHEIATRDLMNALQAETVPQVRRMLLHALELRQKSSQSTQTEANSNSSKSKRGLEKGSEKEPQADVGALIRHELSPAIGWIRLAADGEIADFKTSKTNDAVQKLQRRIQGLIAVIKSNEELDRNNLTIPKALSDNWPDSRYDPIAQLRDAAEEIEIVTDDGLFSILVSNIFQNAIDASMEVGGIPHVEVDWGHTAHDYWIRVSNPFNGERFNLADVLDVGNSSKPSHQGQGLSLVRLVAERLGMAIDLEGLSGIASFTISGAKKL